MPGGNGVLPAQPVQETQKGACPANGTARATVLVAEGFRGYPHFVRRTRFAPPKLAISREGESMFFASMEVPMGQAAKPGCDGDPDCITALGFWVSYESGPTICWT